MLKYSCPKGELSCIIGNLFVELRPPCDKCTEGGITLHGTTYTGEAATLIILGGGCFMFDGDPKSIEKIRQGRCMCNG